MRSGLKIHGQAYRGKKTPEYIAWINMKSRCYNPNKQDYQYYGGRGIKVCNEWLNSFDAFFEHIGKRPSPKHSLDRMRVNEDYKPGNVRWASQKEQVLNMRSNLILVWEGQRKTLSEWADYFEIPYDKLRYLVNKHIRGLYTNKSQA